MLSNGNTNVHTAFANALTTNNQPGVEIGSMVYKNATLLQQAYSYGRVSNKIVWMYSVKTATLGNPLEKETVIEQYDAFGKPLLLHNRGGQYSNLIWSANSRDMVAKFDMGFRGYTYFSSFEYDNGGALSNTALAGKKGYNLSVSQLSLLNPYLNLTNYVVYAWVYGANPFYVNGQAATNTNYAKGSWRLYKYEMIGTVLPSNIIISGSNIIDNLCIMPLGASMTGYVYNEFDQISCMSNGYLHVTYEYDADHNLKYIRDHEGNITEAYEYGIQKP